MNSKKVNETITLLNILIVTAGAFEDLLLQLLYIWFIGMATKHMKFE
jgi:hypothetical protein